MASSSGHFEELHSSDTETQTQDNNATKQVCADRPVVKALWSLLLRGADALRKVTKLVRTKSRDENPPPQDSEQSAAENSCLARSESALKDPAGVERRGSISVRRADERRCSHSWRPYLREHEDDALIHAKLAALRHAFELTLRDPESKHFLDHTTRSLLAALLTLAGKSTEGFGLAWENLMAFVENPTNWPGIAEECREAGTLDVYDMLYESIVLKVLECSENIPDPLKPTLRTQWLSDSTKKTAVMFYAWSQIKKRRESSMRPGGLYSHLYELFDYILPEVMWAAYGSPSNTKDFYFLLRDQVLCFIRDMFSLDRDVYQSPPALAVLVLSDWTKRLCLLQRYLEDNHRLGSLSPDCKTCGILEG